MKIEFVNGVSNGDGKWNIRRVEHEGYIVLSNGTFAPAGSTDVEYKRDKVVTTVREVNHITVVKQPTLLKTALILFHELCHWFVYLTMSWNYELRKKWSKRIDKYL